MGWIFTHREPGQATREFMERELPVTLTVHGKVVASAMRDGVFYAAVQNGPDAPAFPGETWALVVLTQRARGYHNFGYKDMDERMGPNEASAPARVLDLLSPLPECTHDELEYCGTCAARTWRQDCRARLDRVAAAKAVKPGMVIKFPRAFEFSNGHEGDTFEFAERDTFRADGIRYRIPGWRELAFEVVPAA